MPEPDEKKCVELGKKIEKMIPVKTAGVHEKLIFRECPTGKATTEEERKCIYCGKFETIEHLMINCKVAKEIWKEHREAGKEIIGREMQNRDIIIGDWEEEIKGKEEEKQRKIGWIARRLIWASIRLTIMREIWNYRNNKKYEKRWQEDEEDLRERIFIEIEKIWKHWEEIERRNPEVDEVREMNRRTRKLVIDKKYPLIKWKKPPDK